MHAAAGLAIDRLPHLSQANRHRVIGGQVRRASEFELRGGGSRPVERNPRDSGGEKRAAHDRSHATRFPCVAERNLCYHAPMPRNDPRTRFREFLAGDRCLTPASIFDAVSARIAETIGYEMGLFAGSVASFAVLGAPDVVVMTLSDLAEQARRICRASNLPLLVDADHGFGNALNAMRTVEELETAGVSALMIEDLELPAAFGTKGARLVSTEEVAGKLRAALEARRDPNLVVIGRTRAVLLAGIEDAVARLRAYERTGVDALFIAGINTRAELDAIAASVKLPLLVGYLSAEVADPAYLASKRVKVWGLGGPHPFRAAVQGVYDTLKALREGVKPGAPPNIASDELMKLVLRKADYDRWEAEYLA